MNDWIYGELPEMTLLEIELRPDQIFELAGWFGSVLQGAALVAEEEGLTLTE